jgi:hypothetical protein
MRAPETTSIDWRRYGWWYLGALLCLFLAAGAVNLVVDPLGRFRLVDVERFNHVKVGVKRDTRKGKTATLQECQFDVILFGSSRTEFGLDPTYPGLPGRTFNAGLKSSSMYEMQRLGRYVLEHQSPRMAVIALDFFAFNERRIGADDFEESMIGHGQTPVSVAKYLLSVENLYSSVLTVLWNRGGVVDGCRFNGYDRGYPLRTTPTEAFQETRARWLENPELFNGYLVGDDYTERLKTMLLEYRAAGVDVRLFVSPMHAVIIEMMAEVGLQADFFRWKQRLVEIVAEVNAAQPDLPPLELWDFSGYNSITTETVPADGSWLRYYRDPSHFQAEVGRYIFVRLLHEADADTGPEDFGVLLTPDNVAAVVDAQQRAAAARDLDDFGVTFSD